MIDVIFDISTSLAYNIISCTPLCLSRMSAWLVSTRSLVLSWILICIDPNNLSLPFQLFTMMVID